MDEKTFLDLIERTGGFELTLGFRNDIDHFIGGKGNKVWYYISKGNKAEYWIGTKAGNAWSDKHFTEKGKQLTVKDADAGFTIAKCVAQAYFGQDYIESDGRKPTHIEERSMKLSHYVYKFGELAYNISDDYGVTVDYSNINDEEAGYRARNIKTGSDVEPPKEA